MEIPASLGQIDPVPYSRVDLAIDLPRPAVVNGTIKTDYVTKDRKVTIHAYRRDARWTDELEPRVERESDPAGNFKLRLLPGSYRLLFVHEMGGGRTVVQEEIAELKAGDQRLDVTLTPNADVALTIELPEGNPGAKGGYSFPDNPWVGGELDVIRDEWDEVVIRGADGKPRKQPSSIPCIVRGRARVIAIDFPGYERAERTITPMPGKRTTLRVKLRPQPGQYLALKFKETRGQFFSVLGRRAKSNGPWQELRRTRRRGRDAVFVPQGRWQLRVESETRAESAFSFTAGADRSLRSGTLRLKPGVSLRGRLHDPAGRILDRGSIFVWRRDGERYLPVRHKEAMLDDEPFVIAGLDAGEYRFTFDREGEIVIADVEIGTQDVEVDWKYPLR